MTGTQAAAAAAGPVAVIVPSWQRPRSLERCLRALALQTRVADEVVVGLRADDVESMRAVEAQARAFPAALRCAMTNTPGVIAAMEAALTHCRSDAAIVAITDDDTEPRPDWIERIVATFADPRVGGAGGRDWQAKDRGASSVVGKLQWFGRTVGNHHLGTGSARDVDVLKGANCAYRAPLLRAAGFDARLAGAGAQQYWELALCLRLRRAGWRLVYDPAIAVDHHVEPRGDDDQLHRGVFAAAPLSDAVHNETLVLLEHQRGPARAAFAAWALLAGTRHEPGVALLPVLALGGDRAAFAKWRATLDGRWRGWRGWRGRRAGGERTPVIPDPPL